MLPIIGWHDIVLIEGKYSSGVKPAWKVGSAQFWTFTGLSWTSRILEYVETCASLPGHEFGVREGPRIAGRARAYIPVIKTDLDARDSSRAGMARAQKRGITRMFQHLKQI